MKTFLFPLAESSPSDCVQEKSFFCRIRWVLIAGDHLPPVYCLYSFFLFPLYMFVNWAVTSYASHPFSRALIHKISPADVDGHRQMPCCRFKMGCLSDT